MDLLSPVIGMLKDSPIFVIPQLPFKIFYKKHFKVLKIKYFIYSCFLFQYYNKEKLASIKVIIITRIFRAETDII